MKPKAGAPNIYLGTPTFAKQLTLVKFNSIISQIDKTSFKDVIAIKENDYALTASIFKAFCDPSRLIILEVLQTGEKCACVLQERLNMPQSTLSHHMKVLCESGIVARRKDGKWSHYSISEANSKQAIELIGAFTKVNLSDVCKCCN